MSRLSQPQQIFFPVEVRDLYADIGPSRSLRRRTVSGASLYRAKMLHRVAGRQAIVNVRDKTVVGVVSSSYRLFTNHEAMDAAYEVCSLVFPETHPSEWTLNSVDAPATGSYCHIDLTHNTTALQFAYVMKGARTEVPDAFGPFIRVSNSYNGSRALAFSIGFYRKVCTNGLVSPEDIVRFRFEHTRKDMKSKIEFQVERKRLTEAKQSFLDSFRALRECPVDRTHFVRLIRSVLAIANPRESPTKTDRSLSEKEEQDLANLNKHLDTISDKYALEQGENAYAVLNAVTDLASHPPRNRYLRRDRHSIYAAKRRWMAGKHGRPGNLTQRSPESAAFAGKAP